MVDIEEIMAAAIRTVWLQVDGPASRSGYYLEVERARRVRAAIEREGIIITRSTSDTGTRRAPNQSGELLMHSVKL
jgi:hypothetical protein